MSRVVILGAGGHAKVVADILQMRGVEVAGFLDDNPLLWGKKLLGLPVLGAIEAFSDFMPCKFVCGIGSNAVRKEIIRCLGDTAADFWETAVHPRATIARSVNLGCGSVVAAHAVINPDCFIGEHVIVNTGATVDHDCTLSDYVHLAPGAHLAGGVNVAEGTLVGIGSQVIPGCKVGAWSTVGAGATVVADIPDYVVAKGTPACW
ncbi:MAG: acetyltransferase [Anaerolineae bacterium]|nr:acetyltransferase [Anaerolineae bacterium]NUQ06419.1 acetyltransferase [Anaerolineae bacterium]